MHFMALQALKELLNQPSEAPSAETEAMNKSIKS
jgi:hypothetical protein